MRTRLFVRRNGTIHYLNDRGGFRLIDAGGLILLRKQFEESFMILNLTQLAGVLKGDCWNLSRRNSNGAQLRIAWVFFKLRKLITQGVDLLLYQDCVGILIRGECAHCADLNFAARYFSP